MDSGVQEWTQNDPKLHIGQSLFYQKIYFKSEFDLNDSDAKLCSIPQWSGLGSSLHEKKGQAEYGPTFTMHHHLCERQQMRGEKMLPGGKRAVPGCLMLSYQMHQKTKGQFIFVLPQTWCSCNAMDTQISFLPHTHHCTPPTGSLPLKFSFLLCP